MNKLKNMLMRLKQA